MDLEPRSRLRPSSGAARRPSSRRSQTISVHALSAPTTSATSPRVEHTCLLYDYSSLPRWAQRRRCRTRSLLSSPAPLLQPPMSPEHRHTRQLAGSLLPLPSCCCRRVTSHSAATPVRRYARTTSQCTDLPRLLRLHERVLHCCTHCAVVPS